MPCPRRFLRGDDSLRMGRRCLRAAEGITALMSSTPGLLVSVRSADEVAAALAGGADLIDVKEPAKGPRPRPRPRWSRPSSTRCDGKVPVSAALGRVVAQRHHRGPLAPRTEAQLREVGPGRLRARRRAGARTCSTPAANSRSAWRWSRWPTPTGSGPSRCRRRKWRSSPSGSGSRRSCSTPGARTARRSSTS